MLAIGFTVRAHFMGALLATDYPVSPTIEQIAAQSFPTGAPAGEYRVEGGTCKLTVKDTKIANSEGCDALWGVALAEEGKAPGNLLAKGQNDTLTIKFEMLVWRGELKPLAEGAPIKFENAPSLTVAYHKIGTGAWLKKEGTEGKFDIKGGGIVVAFTADKVLARAVLEKPDDPGVAPTAPSDPGKKAVLVSIPDTEALKACREAIGFAESRAGWSAGACLSIPRVTRPSPPWAGRPGTWRRLSQHSPSGTARTPEPAAPSPTARTAFENQERERVMGRTEIPRRPQAVP